MSFAKDGNSDIFTMDLETRLVERITEHHRLIPLLGFTTENLLRSTLIEVDYNKFIL